ncbi:MULTISPECIES: hypothetical protein [unclassified Caulobacter]|uniref:hypothetical protein n=1 Tax=unclassified Caulobacter TaxID=2648921 RepID=UPI0006F3DA58|nr:MULTISPECIES: hypothetical protein [unclassified Caulobacter]KQV56058.1 hypothetical protein ASC62_19310 [Caulobacter sp. Root342]KQV70767.1 hypothetical protein ASC70_03945 [Caulobacter sp. Root343]
MTNHRLATVIAAVLALGACSPQKTEDQPAAPAAPDEVRTPAVAPAAPVNATPAEGATMGGDGSQIQLSGLTRADFQANDLDGELGCHFRTDATDPLLVAYGFVGSKDAAQGLVKVGTYVERIAAPGGFDGLVNGATFTGAGKTIKIAITGPATGGGESPAYPATLTYDRADGAKRVYAGTWTCGP